MPGRGQNHNRDRFEAIVLLAASEHVMAVHARKIEIEQDEIRPGSWPRFRIGAGLAEIGESLIAILDDTQVMGKMGLVWKTRSIKRTSRGLSSTSNTVIWRIVAPPPQGRAR